ncbi:DUF2569 family protein [Paenibacillus luteus]|uniref:DUF2569 family protein n=1 Tax=Paenibacillus luteus TaxID=2545753 RepID=UPI0011419B96
MQTKQIQGIKGWLLFYILLSVIIFFINLLGLYNEFLLFKLFKHTELTIEKTYNISSYLIIEILIIFSLVLLLLRKKYAPKTVIVTESLGIIIGLVDYIMSNKDFTELLDLSIVIVLGAIWILYFRNSKRVRNTF